MKTATKNQKELKTKRDHLSEILTANPATTFAEAKVLLGKLGFEKFGSSEFSDVRMKLGIVTGGGRSGKKSKGPITLQDVELICDLPGVLGVSVKETLEICECVNNYSEQIGSLSRLVEALQMATKLSSKFSA